MTAPQFVREAGKAGYDDPVEFVRDLADGFGWDAGMTRDAVFRSRLRNSGGNTMNEKTVYLSAEQRKATATALKIPLGVKDRPILQTLMVRDGRAFVTDSYVMVLLPWLDRLPEGCWPADEFNRAVKGAGKDRVRTTVQDDGTLLLERFLIPETIRLVDDNDLPDPLGPWSSGTHTARSVESNQAPPDIKTFIAQMEAVTQPGWEPTVAAFDPGKMALVFGCVPEAHNGQRHGWRLHPTGDGKPIVVSVGGRPYGLVMPTRDGRE